MLAQKNRRLDYADYPFAYPFHKLYYQQFAKTRMNAKRPRRVYDGKEIRCKLSNGCVVYHFRRTFKDGANETRYEKIGMSRPEDLFNQCAVLSAIRAER